MKNPPVKPATANILTDKNDVASGSNTNTPALRHPESGDTKDLPYRILNDDTLPAAPNLGTSCSPKTTTPRPSSIPESTPKRQKICQAPSLVGSSPNGHLPSSQSSDSQWSMMDVDTPPSSDASQDTASVYLPQKATAMKEPISFVNNSTAFAVDISGSTRGEVIAQERKAVQSIAGLLSETSRQQAIVIPWDHKIHPFVNVEYVQMVHPINGGTVPATITENNMAIDVLNKRSSWFLFTDGLIAGPEIVRFSKGICRNGLHGTACVIVLFGHRAQRPGNCNISVGISVFASTPDCLFLFQDVQTEEVYILQSKGAFNKLLPDGSESVVLDCDTTWAALPRIRYQDLLRVQIPPPQKLAATEVLLQNRQAVRLDDVFNNKFGASLTGQLLENEDNLKTILLHSQQQGQSRQARQWLSMQSLGPPSSTFHITRPDIAHARQLILQLLQAHKIPNMPNIPSTTLRAMEQNLQAAHGKNKEHAISQRNMAQNQQVQAQNALSRLDENLSEASNNSWRPQMMSRIAQAPQPQAQPVSQQQEQDGQDSQLPGMAPGPPPGVHSTMTENQLQKAAFESVVWIPGYGQQDVQPDGMGMGTSTRSAVRGECTICKQQDAILCLLLKDSLCSAFSGGVATNIPAPNARASFPTNPDIKAPHLDVLHPGMACDACAYHLAQIKATLRLPPLEVDSGAVVGAIPLVSEAFTESGKGQGKSTTLEILDKVVEGRFEKGALGRVLLAIVEALVQQKQGIERAIWEKAREMVASTHHDA